MKKINRYKIGLFLLMFMVFVIPSSVKADPNVVGSGEAGSSTNHKMNDDISVHYSSYGWGYRLAVYDETTGNYLARSNVLGSAGSNRYMISGNPTRKEFLSGSVNRESVVASNGTTGSTFASSLNNFTDDNQQANFKDVFINTLHLSKVGAGSYIIIDPSTGNIADDGTKATILNNFFSQVGLSIDGNEIIRLAKASHVIYLEVEPLMTFIFRDGFSHPSYLKGKNMVLTATEANYYVLHATTGSGQQNIVPGKVGIAQFIDVNEFASGDGYVGVSLAPGFKCDNANRSICVGTLNNYLSGAEMAGAAYYGFGVGVWGLTDLIQGCPESDPNYPTCHRTTFCDSSNPCYADDPVTCICSTGCKYRISFDVPNACDKNGSYKSGYIKDNATWQCVFESTTEDKSADVKTHYVQSIDSKYCSLYCKEEITTNFPTYGAYGYLGTYLQVKSSNSGLKSIGPVTVIGTTTCRTTSANNPGHIDVEQFKTDYAAADADVIAAWKKLEEQAQYMYALNNMTFSSSSQSECTSSGSYYYVDCIHGVSTVNKNDKGGIKCPSEERYRHGPFSVRPSVSPECDPSYRGVETVCYQITGSRNVTKHTQNTYKGSYGNVTVTKVVSDCSNSSHSSISYDTKNYTDAITAYENAVTARDNIVKQYMKCQNFVNNYNTLDPNVSIVYSGDPFYSGEYQLVVDSEVTPYAITSYFSTGSSYDEVGSGGTDKVLSVNTSSTDTYTYYTNTSTDLYGSTGQIITRHNCPAPNFASFDPTPEEPNKSRLQTYEYILGIDCSKDKYKSSVTVQTNTWVQQKTTRGYRYELPSNIYNYVIKESGQSVHSIDSTVKNYSYLGFGNLPIHFSTTINTDLQYTIKLNSLGNNNRFTPYVFNGKNFDGKYVAKVNDYNCWYRVVEDIVKDPGTSIIYRTISLKDPFPGELGTTRIPGYNWREDLLGNSYPDMYIHNNRGVSEYDVYKLDPMYEIELTPSLMKTIQAYNSKQNRTMGSFYGKKSYLGYADFTLTCKKNGSNKNEQCTSDLLRNEWGVTGCAIKGSTLSGYTNCGTTVAW